MELQTLNETTQNLHETTRILCLNFKIITETHEITVTP